MDELSTSFPRQLLWLLKLSEASDFPYRLLRLVLRERALLNLLRLLAALQAPASPVSNASARRERDVQQREVTLEIKRLREEQRREYERASQYAAEGTSGACTIRAVQANDRAIPEECIHYLDVLKLLQEEVVDGEKLRRTAGLPADGADLQGLEIRERVISGMHSALIGVLIGVAREARAAAIAATTPAASPVASTRPLFSPGDSASRTEVLLEVPAPEAAAPSSPDAANPVHHHKRRLRLDFSAADGIPHEAASVAASAAGPSYDDDSSYVDASAAEPPPVDAAGSPLSASKTAKASSRATKGTSKELEMEAGVAVELPRVCGDRSVERASMRDAATSPPPSIPRPQPFILESLSRLGGAYPFEASETPSATARSEAPSDASVATKTAVFHKSVASQTEHYGRWLVRLAVQTIEDADAARNNEISRALERMRARISELHRERGELEAAGTRDRMELKSVELRLEAATARCRELEEASGSSNRSLRSLVSGDTSAAGGGPTPDQLTIAELREERIVWQREVVKARAEAEHARIDARDAREEAARVQERMLAVKTMLQQKSQIIAQMGAEKREISSIVAKLQGEWEEQELQRQSREAELESRGRAVERALAAAKVQEEEVVNLRLALEDALENAVSAKRGEETAREQLRVLENELAELRRDAAQRTRAAVGWNGIPLAERLAQREEDNVKLHETIANLRANVRRVEDEATLLRREARESERLRLALEHEKSLVAQAREEGDKAREDAEAARRDAAAANSALGAARSELSALQAESASRDSQLHSVEAELADRYAELLELRDSATQVERLRQELASVQAELGQEKTRYAEKEEELTITRDRLRALEARIAARGISSRQHSSSSAEELELKLLRARSSSQGADLEQAQAAIAKLKAEIDSRDIDVAQLKSDLRVKLTSIETLRVALEDLGSENNRLMRYVVDAQDARAAFERLKRGKASAEIKSNLSAEKWNDPAVLQQRLNELQQHARHQT